MNSSLILNLNHLWFFLKNNVPCEYFRKYALVSTMLCYMELPTFTKTFERRVRFYLLHRSSLKSSATLLALCDLLRIWLLVATRSSLYKLWQAFPILFWFLSECYFSVLADTCKIFNIINIKYMTNNSLWIQ